MDGRVASIGAVVAQDEAELEYAAVSGGFGALGSSQPGPGTNDVDVSCQMSDPRLSGRLITTQNFDQLAPGRDGGFLRALSALIQSEGGRGWSTPKASPSRA